MGAPELNTIPSEILPGRDAGPLTHSLKIAVLLVSGCLPLQRRELQGRGIDRRGWPTLCFRETWTPVQRLRDDKLPGQTGSTLPRATFTVSGRIHRVFACRRRHRI